MFVYLIIKTSLGTNEIIKALIYFAIYNIQLYKVHKLTLRSLTIKVFKILSENNPNKNKQ